MKKLMRKKLALMLVNLKKKRKYFCEVEYLENSSTQYIDTGYYPNNNTKVEFMASGISADSFSASSSGTWFFGGRQAYAQNMYGTYYVPDTQKMSFNYGVNINLTSVSSSLVYGDKRKFYFDSTGLYIDGVKRITPNAQNAFTSPATMTLFALNNNGSVISPTKYKVHYWKIWDGNTLVRDMIPVLDWDMTPCMYDRVSGQLFYNAGTGTFSYGREIHYVDYLESTGTQYIDTGFYGNEKMAVEIDAQATQESILGYRLFGSRSTSSSKAFLISTNGVDIPYYNFYARSSGTNLSATINNRHVYKMDGAKCYIDGILQYTMSGTIRSFTTPNKLPLYGNYANGETLGLKEWKVWNCKLWENNVLIQNLLPAIDENGVGFMFDSVTHTIFDNAGTGAFEYPDVELEYLESTGTQYINAGFIPNQDTKVELEYKITRDSSSGFPLFCVRESASARGYSYQRYANGFMGGQYGSNINRSQTIGPDSNKHVVVRDKNILYLDGVELVSQQQQTFTCPSNLCINALNTNGTIVVADCGVSYYYMKAWNNNTLVCDFSPVYHNGVACMYDKVSQTYFTNSGTGTFSCKIKENP